MSYTSAHALERSLVHTSVFLHTMCASPCLRSFLLLIQRSTIGIIIPSLREIGKGVDIYLRVDNLMYYSFQRAVVSAHILEVSFGIFFQLHLTSHEASDDSPLREVVRIYGRCSPLVTLPDLALAYCLPVTNIRVLGDF